MSKIELEKDQQPFKECQWFDKNKPLSRYENGEESYEYLTKVKGLVSRILVKVRKLHNEKSEYYRYYIKMRDIGVLEPNYYYLVLERGDKLFEKCVFIRQKEYLLSRIDSQVQEDSRNDLKKTTYCQAFLGEDLDIDQGSYTVYIYKCTTINDVIDYFYSKKQLRGAYLTKVNIARTTRNGKKNYYDYIMFNKNQPVPNGHKYIMIITNRDEFLNWFEKLNKDVKPDSDNGKDNFLSEVISANLQRYFQQQGEDAIRVHPFYGWEELTDIKESVKDQLEEPIVWYPMLSTMFKRLSPMVRNKSYSEIEDKRKKTFGTIFFDNKLNTERVSAFVSENNLDLTFFSSLIKSDYHWFVVNEALLLTKQDGKYASIIEDSKKMTMLVHEYYKKIVKYEHQSYPKETE